MRNNKVIIILVTVLSVVVIGILGVIAVVASGNNKKQPVDNQNVETPNNNEERFKRGKE